MSLITQPLACGRVEGVCWSREVPHAQEERGPRGKHASPRASSRLLADRLEVDLLERRGEDAHTVDAPAGRDELLDEARHTLAVDVLVQPYPLVGLDLDAAWPGEVARRPLGDDAAAAENRHPVAYELDLAQQVRVQ